VPTAELEAELSTRPQQLITSVQTPMYLLNFMLDFDNKLRISGISLLIQRSGE